MFEWIIAYLNEITGNQPMIVSAIMLPLTSGLAYIVRDIPARFFVWLKEQLVSTVVISTGSSYQDKAYHYTLKLLEPHSIDWLRRVNNIVAPIWGDGASITAGFGKSYYLVNGRIVCVDKFSIPNVDGGYEGKLHERATIWWVGRKHWFSDWALARVNEMYSEANKDYSKTRFLRVEETWSDYAAEIDKTTLDDLALDPVLKDQLRIKIRQYRDGKKLYKQMGIAHKLTILLHGIPGTGKTALIRAIAGELDYDIAEGLLALVRIKAQGRRNVVVALDDFESAYSVAKRKGVENNASLTAGAPSKPQVPTSLQAVIDEGRGSSYDLAALLSAMDGVTPLGDVCIILTTNDLESVDEAVTRDARVDLHLEVCAVPADTVKEHFCGLYGPLPEIAEWPDMVGSSIYQIKERALADRSVVIKLINHYIANGTVNTEL